MNKVKTIITTDMEVDDMNSLIHLCLYLNEIDLLGVIYTSSQYHFNGDGIHRLGEITPHYRTSGPAGLLRPRKSFGPDPDAKNLKEFRPFPMGWIEQLWSGPYTEAYPFLIKHDASFPSPEYLMSITKYGNIQFEGDVRFDTEGSDLIKDYLLDEQTDLIYLQSWGGVNTIVRALLSIYETYHECDNWKSIYNKVVSKARILGVFNQIGQDNSFLDAKIPEIYPDLVCLSSEYIYGVYNASNASQKDCVDMFKGKWMLDNIHNHTSALMDSYRLMGDGKTTVGEADVYQFGITSILDFGFPGTKPIYMSPYDFIGEGDSNTYMPLFNCGLRGLENYKYPTLLGRLFTDDLKKPKNGNAMSGEGILFNPFMKAYQEDFAARAEWCYKDYGEANHAPIVKVEKRDIFAKPGQSLELNASVIDPDGDDYLVLWEHFNNYSNYSGIETIRVWEPWKLCTGITIPQDAQSGDFIVLILRVQDKVLKPMTSYGQVVIHID